MRKRGFDDALRNRGRFEILGTGFLLLEDGVSKLLLESGDGYLLLEAGQ